MLKKYSLKALQTAINQALYLDKQMLTKLQALEGKVLEMVIMPLQVRFFIQFKDNTLCLLDTYEGEVDTQIQSSPMGLIRLSVLPASKARSLFNDAIQITGDLELGQQIKTLFDTLDIDWEGHLATFTGDVVAYQVGSFVRKSFSFGKALSTSMRLNTTEFLQEEVGIVPTQMELEDFFKNVDTLAMDGERIEACVNWLVANHANH